MNRFISNSLVPEEVNSGDFRIISISYY
jgi:hypothetical protein